MSLLIKFYIYMFIFSHITQLSFVSFYYFYACYSLLSIIFSHKKATLELLYNGLNRYYEYSIILRYNLKVSLYFFNKYIRTSTRNVTTNVHNLLISILEFSKNKLLYIKVHNSIVIKKINA